MIVAHRRAGKTVSCVGDLVLEALFTRRQDARYAYIAPQYNQAKDIAWGYLKRLTADIPAVNYNETELRADLPNGSRVRLYGADNPDRLRGIYLDGVILDEFADMKPRVWGEIIRPLLSDRKGWAVFIGTPKGRNEFWEMWRLAQQNPDWFSMMLKASESKLIDPSELVSAGQSMSDDQYQQEFECSFDAAIVGAYYGKELREAEGRITNVSPDPDAPVHTAWDLGFRDDTAIWWFQAIRGEVRVLDFHASSGLEFADYVELVKGKGYKPGNFYLPHDARAKTLASGGKSIQEMAWKAFGTGNVRIVPQLSLQDGIQAARAMFPRCHFDAIRCHDGIEALHLYQREWDEDKRCFRESPRHDWTSHPADAFRMMAVAYREDMAPTIVTPQFGLDMTITEMIEKRRLARIGDD